VEADGGAAEVVRKNLERTHLEARGRVIVARVGRWRPPEGAAYTLVLADPPYDDRAAWEAMAGTVEGALSEHAVIAIEHAARVPAPETFAGRPRWRDRRQGDGAVAVYRYDETGEDRA
jgi:16S rRNA G966 N2-methylase RsmD